MFKWFVVACLIGFGGLGVTGSAIATSVRPLLLDEIIDTSAIAFQGTCTANRVEQDTATNFIVTYTTFAVKDVIKGDVAAIHVIKQIGGTLADGASGMIVQGVPKFIIGEDYVVFLAGVSSLGFSSPVGLSQGRFTVRQSAAGNTIYGGGDFRELTARMPRAFIPDTDADAGKPVRQLGLDEFKQMARAHANSLE
jgi:hypothetical protein